jgi:hypothetical protein
VFCCASEDTRSLTEPSPGAPPNAFIEPPEHQR